MIEVQDLRKNFGATRAVDGVSFRVERGEIIGLLGPNGSGKTTIMRILTGFFPPTSGRARIGGLDVETHSLEVRQRTGYLPENVALYPDMPVERFLAFCAEVKGLRRRAARDRVERVIAEVGLEEVRRKEIGKCSKGYRQRTGIAQALIHEPQVLILDEPTVGLDPRQVVEIRELIRSLRGGATILLSTHILPEVSVTCDRVIIMDRGRVLAEDTAEGLHRRVEGVDQTLVRLDAPPAEAMSLLSSLPGVVRVEEKTVPSETAVRFLVTSERGEESRREITRAVVDKGWALLEISPVALTLEDLFVRLVDRADEDEKGH
jgi:ABC-2 type transport system ATP-binding protein